MLVKLFNYNLPKELIAQTPKTPRDHSRLLVYNRTNKRITHDFFYNLPKYLTPNDVLVFNDTKVFPARLLGKKSTGGKAEALLLKELSANEWECLVGANNPQVGNVLLFDAGLTGQLIDRLSDKSWRVRFNKKGSGLRGAIEKIGKTPLPPYIAQGEQRIAKQYQTVYARHSGSAAAPTAGFHFTKNLLKKIKQLGCQIEFVTLHVGLGTFNPVNTEKVEDYKIHSEWTSVDAPTIKRLITAKQQGKRIIAVGTTSTRVLETFLCSTTMRSLPRDRRGSMVVNKRTEGAISTFIYPGYKFKFVDAMITNFHLPKSTLLMLVSAFIGRNTALKIYKLAITMKYRFFSYGDAMLLT